MRKVLLSIFLISLMSCSGALRSQYSYPDLDPPSDKVTQTDRAKSGLLYFDRIADERPNNYIATGAGTRAEAKGDVAKIVAEGLKKAFVQRGYVASDSAPLIVSGAIKEWAAEVKPGIAASTSVRAKFTLEVLDPSNVKIYSALYSGTSDYAGGFSQKELGRSLKIAMDEAIAQAANDDRLLSLLTSY